MGLSDSSPVDPVAAPVGHMLAATLRQTYDVVKQMIKGILLNLFFL
jgi:hypothetical protein